MTEDERADTDHLIEVLARASVGEDVRVDVDPASLDDPIDLIANAVNLLLEDLQHRQREREQALRVAATATAKQEMLTHLSHDMQTPLAILTSGVDLLSETSTNEEHAALLLGMQRAARSLRRFVQQFLDVARLDADQPLVVEIGRVDVVPLLHETVTMFAQLGAVRTNFADEPLVAQGDADRIDQIVANLVINALTYGRSPEGVTVDAHREDDQIVIAVSDRGPGLDPSELQQVFDRFLRGSAAKGTTGSGLGLYVSRALAEAQGGTITVESIPGEGSRFCLRLRAASVAGEAQRLVPETRDG